MSRRLDLGAGVVVIGEVAQAHDGSLGTAHAYIDAIADAGADVVKFQTHIAAAESRPQEPWRVRFSPQDASRFDYWRRMEFTEDQWRGLREHAERRGLAFLSSPFSLEAVELLERVGVAAWKIASGEVANRPLLERLGGAGLPVLLSTGMSPWSEIDAAVDVLRRAGASELVVMQCTSAYPTPPEQVGLNLVTELARRYDCLGGLSDHSGTVHPSLAAVTLGARAVEVHVTLSRRAFGPDVVASVTVEELAQLVAGVRFLERALAAPITKDEVADRLEPMRATFGRSVVLRRSLPAGAILSAEVLTLKKPGGGLPPERLPGLVGRVLARDVDADVNLSEADLSP